MYYTITGVSEEAILRAAAFREELEFRLANRIMEHLNIQYDKKFEKIWKNLGMRNRIKEEWFPLSIEQLNMENLIEAYDNIWSDIVGELDKKYKKN